MPGSIHRRSTDACVLAMILLPVLRRDFFVMRGVSVELSSFVAAAKTPNGYRKALSRSIYNSDGGDSVSVDEWKL